MNMQSSVHCVRDLVRIAACLLGLFCLLGSPWGKIMFRSEGAEIFFRKIGMKGVK